jgi:tripartite-type tricarboxylate transporter receptor subunit TctC
MTPNLFVRSLLHVGLAALALLTLVAPARADFPDKPIKIVVPYPPGGTTDLLARAIAPRLSERLKQPVVVENRAGAGGVIGAQGVMRSPADGYTILFATVATHGILPVLQKPAPYDAVKDFAPITLVAYTPNVLLANPALPVKNVAEMLALAKAKPGTLNFGSTSQGGSPHMSGELLKTMAQIDIQHVPYKGGGPMLIDLIGGQIQLGFDNLPSAIAHVRSGKVRALAVTTAKRWPGAPEIPTLAESGVPGYEASAWFGLLAPAATPKPVVELLQIHVAAILRTPEVEKQFFEQGAQPSGNTPEEFARMIAGELQKWAKVVAATGVKLE